MTNNLWYILAALIFAWSAYCGIKWWKNRKKGCCNGKCSGCPYGGSCTKR